MRSKKGRSYRSGVIRAIGVLAKLVRAFEIKQDTTFLAVVAETKRVKRKTVHARQVVLKRQPVHV